MDTELLAEFERGGVEWPVCGGRPEVKLIAAATAGEAVEEMAFYVDGEVAKRSVT